MRLQLYRRNASAPESISGLAVNTKYIATVRSSGMVEIFSNPSLFKIVAIDVGMKDVQSAEFNGDLLIITSLSEGVLYLDTNTFGIRKCKREGAWRVCCENGSQLVIYSLVEGGSEVYVDDVFVYRSAGYIVSACFGREKGEYLFGTKTSRFVRVKGGKACLDMQLNNKSKTAAITGIAHVVGGEYAMCTLEGDLYIVDVDEAAVKQVIEVRGSALNGVCTIGERVFMSGADSRVVCYSKTARYYTKESQNDMGVSDCLFIKECNGNIITATDDGCVTVGNIPKVERTFILKMYQDRPCAYGNSKMYAAEGQEMLIYDVAEESDKTTLIFKHITKSPILEVAAVDFGAVVRTREGLRVYRYDWSKNAVSVERQIKGFVLRFSVIGGNIWYVYEKKKCLILSVVSAEKEKAEASQKTWTLSKIGVDFIPSSISQGSGEEIIISGQSVVLLNPESGDFRKIESPGTLYFLAACRAGKVHCVGYKTDSEIRKSLVMVTHSLDGGILESRDISSKLPIVGVYTTEKAILLASQGLIKMLSDEEEKKIYVHSVVDGMCVSESRVVAIQRPWEFTKQKLPLQVFKEKYGRR
ncbi:uncharacterized protein NEMAJ01_2123 [Nematocida major]|uniref:uncharacterized protein n=1 Tax=Nematocida major TaxID=1912982 RepID=UPI002007D2E7|nr:uncharacterized protein NEMAJ01_2123 [Nematocida major]KAH9387227.1 hypothetical protein NEMAJ01_2123 [Nematocida major]